MSVFSLSYALYRLSIVKLPFVLCVMTVACFLYPNLIDPAVGIEPDYSDSDNDADHGIPEVEADGLAPPNNNTDSNALSEDEWAKIVAAAGLFTSCDGKGSLDKSSNGYKTTLKPNCCCYSDCTVLFKMLLCNPGRMGTFL